MDKTERIQVRDKDVRKWVDKRSVPPVRTTDGFILPWNRVKIAKSLVKETQLAPEIYGIPPLSEEQALGIATEAEQVIKDLKIGFLSGSLIREIVNTILLKRGLVQYYKLYARVGAPLYEVYRIEKATGFEARENANLQPNPETIHKKKADLLSKEAALLMMPSYMAEAHLSGDLHIHDLEYFTTRSFCQDWDLRYFFRYGLMPDGRGVQTSIAGPAKHAEVAILHAVKIWASGQTNYAGGQGHYGFNFLMAPYLEGLDDRRIRQLAQMLLYEASVDASEKIIIENNSNFHLVDIGSYADRLFEQHQDRVIKRGLTETLANPGFKVQAYDPIEGRSSFKPATALIRHRLREPLVEIITRTGRRVKVTKHHSVFTLDNSGFIVPVKAGELKPGDWIIAISSIRTKTNAKKINVAAWLLENLSDDELYRIKVRGDKALLEKIVQRTMYSKKKKEGWIARSRVPLLIFKGEVLDYDEWKSLKLVSAFHNKSYVPCILEITPELMRLMGYYVAEGCISRPGLGVIIAASKEVENEIEKTVNDLFGAGVTRTTRSIRFGGWIHEVLFSKILGLGKNACTKEIPDFVFELPDHLLREFLMAHHRSDGYTTEHEVGLVTVSEKLAAGLSYILLKFGIVPLIGKEENRKTNFGYGADIWRLQISGREDLNKWVSLIGDFKHRKKLRLRKGARELKRRVPLVEALKRSLLAKKYYNAAKSVSTTVEKIVKYKCEGIGNLDAFASGNLIPDEVVKISEVEPSSEWVYDVEVAGLENFVGGVGGILLHNTQAYVARGGQLVFSSIQIESGIPKIWRDKPVVYRGKVWPDKVYGDYEEEARKFAHALLDTYIKGDYEGKMFNFPKPEVVIRKQWLKDPEARAVLRKAAALSAKFGSTYYDNLVPEYRGGDDGVSCYQCLPADGYVLAKVGGQFGLRKIGQLVEDAKGEKLDVDGAEWWNPNKEIEVPSFDMEGRVKYSKVIRLMRTKSNGKLLKIALHGGLEIKVSPDHPVITRGGIKPACMLEKGDLLPVPVRLPRGPAVQEIDLTEILKDCGATLRNIDFSRAGITPSRLSKITGAPLSRCRSWVRRGSMPVGEFLKIDYAWKNELFIGVNFARAGLVPAVVKLDEKFGKLVGYYLAGGDAPAPRGLGLSFSVRGNEIADDVVGLLRDVFGSYITISTHTLSHGNYNRTVVNVPCTILAKLFEKLGIGRGTRSKQVPQIAYNAPREFVIGLLKGIVVGGGLWNFNGAPHSRIRLAGNDALARGVRNLLLMFGVFTTVLRRAGSVELGIPQTLHTSELVEVVGTVQGGAVQTIETQHALSEIAWVGIKSIEVIPYSGYLYDWEVEGTHNFLHGDGVFSRNCCAYCFSEGPESENFMKKMYFEEGAHFSLGGMQVVSLNLPRIAYRARGDDDRLIEELRRVMNLAKDILMLKRRLVLAQAKAGLIPFATQRPHGAPPVVDLEDSALVVGLIGMNELVQYHTGYQLHESKDAVRLAVRLAVEMDRINKGWVAETGLPFSVSRTPAESSAQRLAVADLIHFPAEAKSTVKGDLPQIRNLRKSRDLPVYYSNGTHVYVGASIALSQKIDIEQKFFPILSGGNIFHVWLGEQSPDPEALDRINEKISKSWIGYYAYTKDLTHCLRCMATVGGLLNSCPKCGATEVDWYSRVTGYYQNVKGWNEGKRQELLDRHRVAL